MISNSKKIYMIIAMVLGILIIAVGTFFVIKTIDDNNTKQAIQQSAAELRDEKTREIRDIQDEIKSYIRSNDSDKAEKIRQANLRLKAVMEHD